MKDATPWLDDQRHKHISPDNDVFQHLASVYASNHTTMSQGKPCKGSKEGFPNGIINGKDCKINQNNFSKV